MVQIKIALKLNEPVWQDSEGNDVDKGNAFGCKVSHRIIKPEYCIVGDETGGNLSMKGDGGRHRFLCGRGDVPRKKASGKINILQRLDSLF